MNATDCTFTFGTESYYATDQGLFISPRHEVKLVALMKTNYKYTKIPEVPKLFSAKCKICQIARASTKQIPPVTYSKEAAAEVTSFPKEPSSLSSLSSIPMKEPQLGSKDVKVTSPASSDSSPLARNGQYRLLQSDDLSADMCHHLLVILADQNKVGPFKINCAFRSQDFFQKTKEKKQFYDRNGLFCIFDQIYLWELKISCN